jgi:hypothetical protein
MLQGLDDREKDIVRRALLAAADGPFFPDWEFRTLFGVDRAEIRETAAEHPVLSSTNQVHMCSVNNALFMLATYPIKVAEPLREYQIERSELFPVLNRIRTSLGKPVEQFLDFME